MAMGEPKGMHRMEKSTEAHEGLISSITLNLRTYKKNFKYEAESCEYYGKIYMDGCHNPNTENVLCNWETCPLR